MGVTIISSVLPMEWWEMIYVGTSKDNQIGFKSH